MKRFALVLIIALVFGCFGFAHAAKFAQENGIPYTCPGAADWLNS